MELKKGKRISKTRKSKTVPAKNVELVTENVFVPITKTIFAKKHGGDTNRNQFSKPKRRIEVVKSTERDNNNATGSLLRKPFFFSEKKHTTNPFPDSKQVSYLFEFETYSNASKDDENRKFPCSVSELPLTVPKKCGSTNKIVIESSKYEKIDKEPRKSSVGVVKRAIKKKPKLRKSESIICRAEEKFKRIGDNVSGLTMVSSSSSNSNAPRTVVRPVAITLNDSALKLKQKTNLKAAVSASNAVNREERIKFPVTYVESNDFSTPFDLSTSQNILNANDTDSLGEINSKILANNFRNFADYSFLSLLETNPPRDQEDDDLLANRHPCKIKYSWQIVGTGCQTSRTLLESLIKEYAAAAAAAAAAAKEEEEEPIYNCTVKYSWQIVGISTQTSKGDLAASKCRSPVSILSGKSNAMSRDNKETGQCEQPCPLVLCRKGKRYIVLSNQWSQTFAHKQCQTFFTEFYE